MDSLSGIAKSGDINMLTGFLNSNNKSGSSNPVMDLVKKQVVNSLMSKVGLGAKQSSGIADSLIPHVLGGLVGQAKDPKVKGFEISDIIGALTGGDKNASSSLLSKLGGGALDSLLGGGNAPKGKKGNSIQGGLGGLLGKFLK